MSYKCRKDNMQGRLSQKRTEKYRLRRKTETVPGKKINIPTKA